MREHFCCKINTGKRCAMDHLCDMSKYNLYFHVTHDKLPQHNNARKLNQIFRFLCITCDF